MRADDDRAGCSSHHAEPVLGDVPGAPATRLAPRGERVGARLVERLRLGDARRCGSAHSIRRPSGEAQEHVLEARAAHEARDRVQPARR